MAAERFIPNTELPEVEDCEMYKEILETKLVEFSTKLNGNITKHSHHSVYCGIGGVYYMNLLLYEYTKNDNFLLMSKNILKNIKQSKLKHTFSFLEGITGIYSLSSVLYHYIKKETDDDSLKYVSLLLHVCNDNRELLISDSCDKCELLYGKTGFLYSLFFCKNVWYKSEYKRPMLKYLFLIAKSIINHGQKMAATKKDQISLSLYYEWHDSVYLGAAHGYAGILFILFKLFVFLLENVEDLCEGLLEDGNVNPKREVKETNVKDSHRQNIEIQTELCSYVGLIYKVSNEILSLYMTDDYNMLSSVKQDRVRNKKEKLVQWCHGNPGYVLLIIELIKTENMKILEIMPSTENESLMSLCKNIIYRFKERYEGHIEKMGNLIWEKGLLKKGMGLCHGIPGNGIIFLYIYNYTKNRIWYIRATQYALYCIKNFKQLHNIPDRPDSLFEGYAGLAVFLSFLLKPKLTHFPAMDFSRFE